MAAWRAVYLVYFDQYSSLPADDLVVARHALHDALLVSVVLALVFDLGLVVGGYLVRESISSP